jgi:hypothetical protein
VKVTLTRATLERAVGALVTVADSTHAAAAEERRLLRATMLRERADELHAAAQEIRDVLRLLDREP